MYNVFSSTKLKTNNKILKNYRINSFELNL